MIKNIIFFIALVLISCAEKPKINYDQKADHRLVFIGNSYTFNNQLNLIVAQLVNRLEKKTVHAVRITSGSYTSHMHLKDLTDKETAIHKVFVTDAHQGKKWDLLVLQENSRIPGLLGHGATSQMPNLYRHGEKISKRAMLMMTWAYAAGDPGNPEVYPNYLEMQKQLDIGTRFLAKEMSKKGGKVTVIPAGLGYQKVYEDIQKKGKDPLAKDSLFRQLYKADGRHPSLAGSYLTACIVAALYTEKNILDTDGKPTRLDGDFANYLRQVAARVVKDEKSRPK